MAEIRYDKNHPAGPDGPSRMRSRTRNSGSGEYTDYTLQQGSSTHPLTHKANVTETAHMPLSEPYTSLLNQGLSRNHFAYNGDRRRR
jgi:hypothetical protein